jgi:hypothetical protein
VVRSYQRLFHPVRRIYAIDGRTLPIPGGLPLRWLAAATLALLVVLALAAMSPAIMILAGALGAFSMLRSGRRRLAVAAAGMASSATLAAGLILTVIDWPLRLVVLPAVIATAMTQLSFDGRPAHRFAWSWLGVRVAGRRRLGHPLPPMTAARGRGWSVRVAHDAHGAKLHRARVAGPARVRFAAAVVLLGGRRGRRIVKPVDHRGRRGGLMLDAVELSAGERLEIRP